MEKKLSIQQIKNSISLVDYLARNGHHSVGMSGKRHRYLSPFRNEKVPSMFVDDEGGLWNDFGYGGGSIIDLAIALHNLPDARAALEHLISFTDASFSPRATPKPIEGQSNLLGGTNNPITNIRPAKLNHFVLLKYLEEKRGISKAIAQKYLRLVWYDNKGRKSLFGIGWQNDSGAWELRSAGKKDFKAVTGKKDVTTISDPEGSQKLCFLFESMLDFLSVLELKNVDHLDGTVIVLNSTALIKRIIPYLKAQSFETIHTLFDNDPGGQEALKKLRELIQHPDLRPSTFYSDFNDVNDYLVDRIGSGQ